MENDIIYRIIQNIKEETSEGGPVPCTILDVLVVDKEGMPLPKVKLTFYFDENPKEPTVKTNTEGKYNDYVISTSEGVYMSFDKNKVNTLEKNHYRNCTSKKIIKIKTDYLKNENLTEHEVCLNNGYLFNEDPEKVYRHKTALDTNKIKLVINTTPKLPETQKECLDFTKKHFKGYKNIGDGKVTVEELGGVDKIKKDAQTVKGCYMKYKDSYPEKFKLIINRLINVRNDLSFFQLTFTKDEIRSIYGESKTMSLKNTIRKVVSESVENKSEKTLIEERFKFSLRGVNKKNLTESKRVLRNERYNLIKFGYSKELVRESFLDVMKGLYGNDDTNVLSDIKTRLGQRIADQVKNKQEEHEMILSAFNELPEDMIERAIKENRVDELSTEVATKALENYKTQFGTEGLSGIMIASVDENKFKQEVAKLIEPAIKDITTKMDEKLKQVQDAVSGGLNPTD